MGAHAKKNKPASQRPFKGKNGVIL